MEPCSQDTFTSVYSPQFPSTNFRLQPLPSTFHPPRYSFIAYACARMNELKTSCSRAKPVLTSMFNSKDNCTSGNFPTGFVDLQLEFGLTQYDEMVTFDGESCAVSGVLVPISLSRQNAVTHSTNCCPNRSHNRSEIPSTDNKRSALSGLGNINSEQWVWELFGALTEV